MTNRNKDWNSNRRTHLPHFHCQMVENEDNGFAQTKPKNQQQQQQQNKEVIIIISTVVAV